MRKQFVHTIESIMAEDKNAVILLGDVGVFGFKNCFELYPDRTINIGILEQTSIGIAAGLSKVGLMPTFYSIAPFVVERALEQLKLDFGYQSLGGNFVSVGASYDYASLGPTHHCPADVGILNNIPGIEIVVPGTPSELDILYKAAYKNGNPTYFRLSEKASKEPQKVMFGKGNLIKRGNLATVIAVGPMLDAVLQATENLDVCVLYYSTINPFDSMLLECARSNKFIVCEPYYASAISANIIEYFSGKPVILHFISVPKVFIRNNGSVSHNDEAFGFNSFAIREKIKKVIRP
jgi:transketolase